MLIIKGFFGLINIYIFGCKMFPLYTHIYICLEIVKQITRTNKIKILKNGVYRQKIARLVSPDTQRFLKEAAYKLKSLSI